MDLKNRNKETEKQKQEFKSQQLDDLKKKNQQVKQTNEEIKTNQDAQKANLLKKIKNDVDEVRKIKKVRFFFLLFLIIFLNFSYQKSKFYGFLLGNQGTGQYDQRRRHFEEHTDCPNHQEQGEGIGTEEAENPRNKIHSLFFKTLLWPFYH